MDLAVAQTSTVGLNVGGQRIEAEVANDDDSRSFGLMYRRSLPDGRGMVFVYPAVAQRLCMWMKNTLIPLSVAFLDEEGRILNIEDMAPQTEDNHCARGPARYALEMNRGWFARHGIKAGDRIEGVKLLVGRSSFREHRAD
jgi:uncharacterized membrane protein (UPF0127 family)